MIYRRQISGQLKRLLNKVVLIDVLSGKYYQKIKQNEVKKTYKLKVKKWPCVWGWYQ